MARSEKSVGIIYLTPQPHDIVKGGESATDLGGEAGAPGVEITPAMIEAGAEVIWSSFNDIMVWGSAEARGVATAVFEAMSEAALSGDSSGSARSRS